ncbi:MAG: ABC transporter permease [Candidatus Cloacimonetes bacterium]|nr:ABC transporter permease [Candidatus Cloacimonadota bacterium]
MSIKKIFIVYRKEMLDLFRDRRTIISSIVIPIILYPVLMIGFNTLLSRQTVKLHEQEVIIYIIDNAQDEYSQLVYDKLEETPRLQILQPVESYEQLFNEKLIQALVTLDSEDISDDFTYLNAKITYNRVDEKSELAYSIISRVLRDLEKDMIGSRLRAINISEDILKVIEIEAEDVATEQQTLGMILARILPYFLILISISGASVAAVDLVAGEKERGTLETILVSAAKRSELVLGKFSAVISISLITVLLNLASIFFSFRHLVSQAAQTVAIQIPFGSLFLILILMVPMIIFFAAIVFSFSTYSRNMKESYSYTQPLMIVAMLLSLVSALPAIDTTFGMTLIPVINVSLMIKEIMLGDLNIALYLSTLISTCILVVLAVAFSIRLFYKEEVLFRTTEDSLITGGKKGGWKVLSPGFAMLFFIVILLLFYYVGLSWQIRDLEQGLIRTLIFLVFLPILIVIRFGKLDMKETLSIRGTKPLNYITILLISIPIFILVNLLAQIINIIYPFPEHYLESFQQLFFLEGRTFWYSLFVIALLPGITEEVMFRGYFIKAFREKGVWNSILASGILFAVLHLDMFRFIPVAILGFWLGYTLLRTRSIFIPILAHTANNALALIVARYGDYIPGIQYIIKDDMITWWTAVPAVIILILIFKVFNKTNDPLSLKEQPI